MYKITLLFVTLNLILLKSLLAFEENNATQNLSFNSRKSLEAKGFTVLGLAPKLVASREDSIAADEEIIRISVSFDLSKSEVNPIWMGRPQQGISSQTSTDTIMTDGFEGDFPGTKWQRSGDPTWGKTDYRKHSGNYSIWCANDLTRGVNPDEGYPANCQSIIIYGPFNLSNVNYAQLKFSNYMHTEYEKDWFFYMASTDGENFQGIGVSGSTGDSWDQEELHMADVPAALNNIVGSSSVWIALLFESDSSGTGRGVYIDDVILRKSEILGTIL